MLEIDNQRYFILTMRVFSRENAKKSGQRIATTFSEIGLFLGNVDRFVDKQSKYFRESLEEIIESCPGGWNLYCIYDKMAGAVKVGISTNPLQRLDHLQTGNPSPLYIGILVPLPDFTASGAKQKEKELHQKLAHLRCKGGSEWFKECQEQKTILEQYFMLKGPVEWTMK